MAFGQGVIKIFDLPPPGADPFLRHNPGGPRLPGPPGQRHVQGPGGCSGAGHGGPDAGGPGGGQAGPGRGPVPGGQGLGGLQVPGIHCAG